MTKTNTVWILSLALNDDIIGVIQFESEAAATLFKDNFLLLNKNTKHKWGLILVCVDREGVEANVYEN